MTIFYENVQTRETSDFLTALKMYKKKSVFYKKLLCLSVDVPAKLWSDFNA